MHHSQMYAMLWQVIVKKTNKQRENLQVGPMFKNTSMPISQVYSGGLRLWVVWNIDICLPSLSCLILQLLPPRKKKTQNMAMMILHYPPAQEQRCIAIQLPGDLPNLARQLTSKYVALNMVFTVAYLHRDRKSTQKYKGA